MTKNACSNQASQMQGMRRCRINLSSNSQIKRTSQSGTQYQKDRPRKKDKKAKANAEPSPVE
ncbi:hypothetical protein N7447_000928 [Penicillium robsamsonii]|uniref:uncharacterized protein n=1 Tax=Penicillium robsamsonii TaxID=1792511 RepID=UPI0025467538|nr:uncharacterized protein N7447_000928 [Penicillium robsamsonii]KAJ5834902.1 hypothetical protein N7447_000928 [Penicillium robsamsonii]